MDASGAIVTGLAGRYASALFDLARDGRSIDTVQQSLGRVRAALAETHDLKALTTSPTVSRDQARAGMAGVAAALGLDEITTKFLGVLAVNRRLAALPAIIRAFDSLVARHRGEITAEVTSAVPLTDDQVTALKDRLRSQLGRDVAISPTVDPAILGGLVVKVGSRQIDSSIANKLNSLAYAMKG